MLEIHLMSEGVDDVFTVGGDDADVTMDEALTQIPPAPLEELVPGILARKSSVVRTVMMYHAALSYIDAHNLWQKDRVTLSVDMDNRQYSVDWR